ncbi:MAG: 2-oxoacid:acceptor oxidoreductase subunit alpha [bacterium]
MAAYDRVLRLVGEDGDSVLACGALLARAAARGGSFVHTYHTADNELRCGTVQCQVRLSDSPVQAVRRQIHLLLFFSGGDFTAHKTDLIPGGTLLCDPQRRPEESQPGLGCCELPLTELTRESTGDDQLRYLVAAGALLNLLGIPAEAGCEAAVGDQLADETTDTSRIRTAITAGYHHAEQFLAASSVPCDWDPAFAAEHDPMLLDGNQAVALGALAAGVDFVAGHPLAPATSILDHLSGELSRNGGAFLWMEDEQSAAASLVGASFAGRRCFTASSGPGLLRMGESVSFAAMAETPLVIVDVMRAGPATGLPTRTAQADLDFARYGTNGEAPRCVIAPATVADCFWQTVRAFRIAETYQLPVLLLTDQALACSSQIVNRPDFETLEPIQRLRPGPGQTRDGFARYAVSETGVSPQPIPGLDDLPYVASGYEHDPFGRPDSGAANHLAMTGRRFHKLAVLGKRITQEPVLEVEREGTEVGIIGWGSSYGAITEALQRLELRDGVAVAHLHPRLFSPLNEWRTRRFLGPLRKIICPEQNHTGQYARILRNRFGVTAVELSRQDGCPFTPGDLYRAIKEEL